jgi:hypothetical protein
VSIFATGADSGFTVAFTAPGPGPSFVVPPGGETLDWIITFTAQASGSNYFSGLDDGLALGPDNVSGGSLTIDESYCLGQASLANCPASQSGSLQTMQNGPSIITSNAIFAPLYNLITVQLEVVDQNLTSMDFGPPEVITSLYETDPPSQSAAAPEPSALLMIGAGLSLIGVGRLGRKGGSRFRRMAQ